MATPRIGTLIDRLWKAELEIKFAEKQVKKLKQKYTIIEDDIFARFNKDAIDGAVGKLAKVILSRPKHPVLNDYAKLEKWVYKNKALDLFHRRLSSTAWKERKEATGRPIPGIKTFEMVKLSIKKR